MVSTSLIGFQYTVSPILESGSRKYFMERQSGSITDLINLINHARFFRKAFLLHARLGTQKTGTWVQSALPIEKQLETLLLFFIFKVGLMAFIFNASTVKVFGNEVSQVLATTWMFFEYLKLDASLRIIFMLHTLPSKGV